MFNIVFSKCCKCQKNNNHENYPLCDNCQSELKIDNQINGALNNEKNIGKTYRIWCKENGHPKLKYEKHLIKDNPDKYKDYYSCFIGTLSIVFNDKWNYGELMSFNKVSFVNKKNKIIDNWHIHINDVLFYEMI